MEDHTTMPLCHSAQSNRRIGLEELSSRELHVHTVDDDLYQSLLTFILHYIVQMSLVAVLRAKHKTYEAQQVVSR
jgi:hypothetical protein